MTEPIELRFRVDCGPEHAFRIWTERIDTWWPRGHSVSSDPNLTVSIEPRVGGRILETTGDGHEHEWGEVITWDPPRELSYLWHIYGPREQSTRVDISFDRDGEATLVTIVHTGWDELVSTRPDLRGRNERSWSHLVPRFIEACH